MAIYKNKKKYVAIRCIVYCVFLITVDGFDYNIATQRSLCRAQCRARQLAGLTDNAACNSESLTWITHCDAPNCVGTCSIFFADHLNHTEDAVRVPDIHLSLVGNRDVELVWLPAITSRHTLSPSHVIYVIEETLPDYVYGGLSTTVLVNSTSATSFQTPLHGLCYPAQYRVMAVNRYGSAGFTHHVVTPAIPPGPVQNLQLTGAGIYYYEDKLEQDISSFMTVIKWDPPAGWMERDIDHYEWNPMIKRWCDDIGHDTFPTFQEMVNQTNHILMTINSGSIGCKFETQIRAVSKCNITGPWTDLPVDLTNCSSINGFRCNDKPVSPPGLVKNVSLSVTSASREEVMKYYADPGLNLTCPLFVYLHIKWRPPPDMGSRGVIDKYIIRSGRTKREFLPIPPSFIETPTTKEAPNDTIEIIFELPSHTIPYTFAVQVVALGPGQLISDNEWGLFPMYTMEVSRNESGIASLIQEGKVLLDKAGIVIVYINNFRHAQFMFDQPMGKSENITFERYAMQWGPLVGPDGNQTMMVENETVVGRNQCMLRVHLAHPGKRYGLQVRHLLDIEEDDEQGALESEFFTFKLPGENETALGPSKQNVQTLFMTPAWVTLVTVASVLVGIAISTVTLRHLHKQHRFKHLERRLIATEEHVDEEGDHYFVFRPAETRATDADTTVVADRWELPHHCLKIGQLLGSGAFGRVVKGRVSKSLLTHRGTDVFMAQQQTGPYLTVAIKIIQENSEEKYIQDFLNEIQMMKDIGYHRNIVSLLGCCTLRQPYCLVVENLPNGDLLAYLRKLRQEIKQHESITDGYVNQDFEIFTPADLMSVAQQVASGMDFLNQKGFVHRDLAARNVLVGENKNVKIADFGLARYIYHDVNKIYVHRRGGKLPLRWMAPEAIFNLVFSSASDVWSFGILLYEIVSLGGSPYPSWSNADLLKYLKQGIRMERPDNCSLDVYEVMLQCWEQDPLCRPSFSRLCQIFTMMLEEITHVEYFHFDVDETRDYCMIDTDDMDMDGLDLTNFCSSDDAVTNIDSVQVEQISAATVTTVADIHITDVASTNPKEQPVEYSDLPFVRNHQSTLSFHNEMYTVGIDGGLICGDWSGSEASSGSDGKSDISTEITETYMSVSIENKTKAIEMRHQRFPSETRSSTSDDVFQVCTTCNAQAGTSSQSPECQECLKLTVIVHKPEMFDAERCDSAYSSTTSDDSEHQNNGLSELPENNHDYRVPISFMKYTCNYNPPETAGPVVTEIGSSHGDHCLVYTDYNDRSQILAGSQLQHAVCRDRALKYELQQMGPRLMLKEFVKHSDRMTIGQTKF